MLSVNEQSYITNHTLAHSIVKYSSEFKKLAIQQPLQEKNAFSNM